MARALRKLEALGLRISLIDMGGGIGVSYAGETEIDPSELGKTMSRAFSAWPGARLLIEPGRYLSADCGYLLTKALYRKQTSRRSFVVVDAAMNDFARPALYGAFHPILPARPRGGPSRKMDVVGPVCESGDFLARQRPLQRVEQGDILALRMAGAYGFSMSSQYNSRPRAAEVLVDGSRARLVRRRETLADIVRLEVP